MRKMQLIGGLAILAVLPLMHVAPVAASSDIELSNAARIKLEAGDSAKAKELYAQILSEFPSSPKAPEAKLKLAYFKIRDHAPKAEVISAFDQMATAYPDSPEAAEALFRSAQSRLKECNKILGTAEFDETIRAFEKAAAHPKAGREQAARCRMQGSFIHIMRFYNSHDKADLKAAISSLEICADSSVDTPAIAAHALLGVGESQILLGNYKDAEATYSSVAELTSGKLPFEHSMALYGLGMAKAWRNDYAGASRSLESFLSGIPGDSSSQKDAAWRRNYSPDYAPAGRNAVPEALIQMAYAKFLSGDTPTAKKELELVCSGYAGELRVAERARQFLNFVAPSLPITVPEMEGATK